MATGNLPMYMAGLKSYLRLCPHDHRKILVKLMCTDRQNKWFSLVIDNIDMGWVLISSTYKQSILNVSYGGLVRGNPNRRRVG